MKKRGKTIQINLSNRLLYTIIAIGVLLIAGVGVYALTPGTAPNPGHLISELAPPTSCGNGEYLQFVDSTTGWACAAASATPETDPTVNSYIKDKANCVAITGGAGLCDGVDNVGVGDGVGFTGYQRVSNTCSYSTTCTASCPSGKKVIGGGCPGGHGYPNSDTTFYCQRTAKPTSAWAVCAYT